jgi:hypothetical protein
MEEDSMMKAREDSLMVSEYEEAFHNKGDNCHCNDSFSTLFSPTLHILLPTFHLPHMK